QPRVLRGSRDRWRHRLATLPLHHATATVAGHVLRAPHRGHQLVQSLLARARATARRRTVEQRGGPGLLPLPTRVQPVPLRPGSGGVVHPLRHRPRVHVLAAALRGEAGALRMNSYRLGRFLGRSGTYVLLIFMSAITIFPFIWMVGTSLKTTQEIFAFPPTLWPAEPQWQNFATVLERVPFLRFYLNSIVVTGILTFSQVATAALAGYAFA